MKIWTTKSGHQVFRVLKGRCNVFLVYNGSNYFMVDTGGRLQWDSLFNSLDALAINEKVLQAVIMTHTHFDHAENAAKIKEYYKPSFYVHQSEAAYLEKGDSPLPGGSLVITRWFTNQLAGRPGMRFPYQPVIPDIMVEDSCNMDSTGFNAVIMHTPGHSSGSLSVIVDGEIAIVGDTMWGLTENAVFPPFADQPRLLVESWRKLLETGCRLFLPAHGSERKRSLVEKQFQRFKVIYDLE